MIYYIFTLLISRATVYGHFWKNCFSSWSIILFSGFLKNKSEKIKEAMITINNQFRSNYLLFFMCSVILSPCLLAHIFVFFVHLCRQKQRTVKQKGYDIWNHIVCMSEVCGLNCFWVKNSAICGFHGVLYEKWISKQSNKTWNIITSKQASLQLR